MAARQVAGRKPPKLRKFSGEDENVEDFITEVHVLMGLQVLPAKQAALWIIDSLEGPARALVLTKSHHDLDTPQKVLDILKGEWGDRKSLTMHRRAFYGKAQSSGETISEYAATLKQLWQRCNEGVPMAERLSDDSLINTFIDGLRIVALKRELRKVAQTLMQNGQAVNLQELILIARDWMKEEETASPIRTAEASVVPEAQVDFVKDKIREAKVTQYHSELEDVKKKLEECATEMQLLRDRWVEGQREIARLKKEVVEFGNRPKQTDPPRCWHCGSDQHFRAQCPGVEKRGKREQGPDEYLERTDLRSGTRWSGNRSSGYYSQPPRFRSQEGMSNQYQGYSYRPNSGNFQNYQGHGSTMKHRQNPVN